MKFKYLFWTRVKLHKDTMKQERKESTKAIRELSKIDPSEYYNLLKSYSEVNINREKEFQTLRKNNSYLPQLIIADQTEKGLKKVLYTQGGRISICSAEGRLLSRFLQRKSGFKAYELFLQSYNMEKYVNYEDTNQETASLRNPSINIISMTEPSVIEKLYRKEGLRTSGFFPCLQSIFTSSFVASIKPKLNAEKLQEEFGKFQLYVICRAEENFSQDHKAEIHQLTLTDEAKHFLLSFENENDEYIRAGNYCNMEDYTKKIGGIAIRLAVGIHAWLNSDDVLKAPISDLEMRAGIALAKILLQHACYIYNDKGRQFIELVERTIRAILTRQLDTFNESDITRNLNRVHIETLKPVLKFLEDCNCLRSYKREGKPLLYITNPELLRWRV